MRRNITILAVIMVLFTLFYISPFFWLLLTSLKTRYDALSTTPKIFFTPTLSNYNKVFVERGFTKYFVNSLIVAFVTSILTVVLAYPAAYTFSRFKLRGDNHIYFVILTTRMGPGVLVAVPIYLMFSKIGLWDTHIVLILVHTAFNLALAVWLIKGFVDDIPKDLDEAAWLDGLSPLRTMFKIVMPLCYPGIATALIFVFILSWGEFLYALLLTGNKAQTLPVAVAGLVTPHGTLWGQIAAVATLTSIPPLIAVFFLQRYIVRGLTFGAVK